MCIEVLKERPGAQEGPVLVIIQRHSLPPHPVVGRVELATKSEVDDLVSVLRSKRSQLKQ